ncbi:hypothetical protein [Arthrobacter sp. H5]|uniref:hypothetical protein n=1 Tax=Arthrobacter sp. H5 TaxID=1267973 RepID=UPI000487AD9D|nr:hypothetical protein [Arthrobacter sp. H5]
MKLRPSVQIFADKADDLTLITSYNHDHAVSGMWDGLKLADEMSEAALETARNATRTQAS